MPEFLNVIAPLSMQNLWIDERQKKSMLIHSLPESLSTISTSPSAQQEITTESFDALIWAELDRKKNPHNMQDKQGISALLCCRQNLKWQERVVLLGWSKRKSLMSKKRKCHQCQRAGHSEREFWKCQPFIRNKNRHNPSPRMTSDSMEWSKAPIVLGIKVRIIRSKS